MVVSGILSMHAVKINFMLSIIDIIYYIKIKNVERFM